MKTILPIDKMTRAEKLQAMDELWQDLSRNEGKYKSPAWHEGVLKERETKVQEGAETFIPWEEAKRKLRKRNK